MPAFAVAVLNHGGLPQLSVEAFAAAADELVGKYLVPFWPDFAGTTVRAVPIGGKEDPHEVALSLAPQISVANTMGYHTKSAFGLPVGIIELEACTTYGVPWTVPGAHEIVEILGNPELDQFIVAPDGRRFPRELVDFVTSAQMTIVDVPVCSAVTPLFFDPTATRARGQFDLLDQVTEPFPKIPLGGWAQWQLTDGSVQSAYGDSVTLAMQAYVAARQGRAFRLRGQLSGRS